MREHDDGEPSVEFVAEPCPPLGTHLAVCVHHERRKHAERIGWYALMVFLSDPQKITQVSGSGSKSFVGRTELCVVPSKPATQ